ncbi:peptidylprolyl isomerase [Ferrovibrio sp.]|uniref:peptidylprolyl isomerase n=1 Tax=Ferrovibrio sp. TaxID=1917215 RepID=UPI00311EB00D
MKRLTAVTILIACIGLLPLCRTAMAQQQNQDLQRIVALVNDDVISMRDLVERSRVIMVTARLPDNAEVRRAVRDQAMRSLIDERLQMQEAKKRGISVSQEEVDAAIARLEEQNRIPAGRFEDFAIRAGIDPAIMISQIRAELTWARMVRSRLAATTVVTDQEVDEAVAKLKASAGQTEDLLSEILIPVDSPDQEEPQRQAAERIIEQLRNGGASFPALARQFSRGTTASNGGDMGWVTRGTLPEETEAAAARLQKGDISAPIRTIGGYQIIALRDRRRIALPGAEEARVTLKQILLPLPANASQGDIQSTLDLARTVRPGIRGCDDIEPLAAQLKAPGSGSLGTLRLADLPENFRQAVGSLKVNETSDPVATPRAVHLFTLCAREEPDAFDRNQIRQQLLIRKAEQLSQRYLRELRRDATIEFR